MERWGPLALKAGEVLGKSFRIAEDSETLMLKAGFSNVKYRTFKWPIGTWPKDPKLKRIGAYNRLAWEDGMEGWAMSLFTNHLGVCPTTRHAQSRPQSFVDHTDRKIQWRREEIQVLLANIRTELRNPALHGYQIM